MSDQKKADGLEIEQDLEFQRKEWRIGRVGWVVLGVFLILGLLGVFGGSGVLNTTTVGDQEQGFWIEHERFLRNMAPTTLTIFVAPEQLTGDLLRIRLPQAYISEFELQSIEPEPEQVTVTGDGQEYSFNLQNPRGPVTIRFYLRAAKVGLLRGDCVLNDNQILSIRQFSYP